MCGGDTLAKKPVESRPLGLGYGALSMWLPGLMSAALTYLPTLSSVPRASWDRSVKALGREVPTGDYYCYCSVERGQWLPRGMSHSWWNSRHQERLFWATEFRFHTEQGL